MGDQDPTRRTLSEISHLFLSDVRERHMGGAPRPQRVPPGQRPPAASPPARQNSLDLTSDELGSIYPASDGWSNGQDEQPSAPPVSVVIRAQTGGSDERIRQYARHLALQTGPIGLIELEADGVRIQCIDPTSRDKQGAQPHEGVCADIFDVRILDEAIEEMSGDVELWLLAAHNLRAPAIRALLNRASHWVLLSTCDHDGIVSSYRVLKGLCDPAEADRPRLTLALMNAATTAEAARVYRKLAGVCEQFLNWPLEAEPVVNDPMAEPGSGPAEFEVLRYRSTAPSENGPTSAPSDSAPHIEVIAGLLDRSETPSPLTIEFPVATQPGNESLEERELAETDRNVRALQPASTGRITRPASPLLAASAAPPSPAATPTPINTAPAVAQPSPEPSMSHEFSVPKLSDVPPLRLVPAEPMRPFDGAHGDVADVLEIAGQTISAESILSAVLDQGKPRLVECPVRPPACGSARVVVGRDRRVCMVAVSLEGLSELRTIGRAWKWLVENINLVSMAFPQMEIDTHNPPQLRLLVDQSDISAGVLQPMLQAGHVTVEAYRKLRWNGRHALLLDAA